MKIYTVIFETDYEKSTVGNAFFKKDDAIASIKLETATELEWSDDMLSCSAKDDMIITLKSGVWYDNIEIVENEII